MIFTAEKKNNRNGNPVKTQIINQFDSVDAFG